MTRRPCCPCSCNDYCLELTMSGWTDKPITFCLNDLMFCYHYEPTNDCLCHGFVWGYHTEHWLILIEIVHDDPVDYLEITVQDVWEYDDPAVFRANFDSNNAKCPFEFEPEDFSVYDTGSYDTDDVEITVETVPYEENPIYLGCGLCVSTTSGFPCGPMPEEVEITLTGFGETFDDSYILSVYDCEGDPYKYCLCQYGYVWQDGDGYWHEIEVAWIWNSPTYNLMVILDDVEVLWESYLTPQSCDLTGVTLTDGGRTAEFS